MPGAGSEAELLSAPSTGSGQRVSSPGPDIGSGHRLPSPGLVTGSVHRLRALAPFTSSRHRLRYRLRYRVWSPGPVTGSGHRVRSPGPVTGSGQRVSSPGQFTRSVHRVRSPGPRRPGEVPDSRPTLHRPLCTQITALMTWFAGIMICRSPAGLTSRVMGSRRSHGIRTTGGSRCGLAGYRRKLATALLTEILELGALKSRNWAPVLSVK